MTKVSGGLYANIPTNNGSNIKNRMWGSGYPVHTSFQTLMPPNGPSCFADPNAGSTWRNWGRGRYMKSAGSYHTGGVNASFGDGSVRFVAETISWLTSGYTQSTARIVLSGPSQFGVWGALGSSNGGETASL